MSSRRLIAAAKEFTSRSHPHPIGRAFALADGGNIDDSVEEFEDPELDCQVDAPSYRNYAVVMFIHGRIFHTYCYARNALALQPTIMPHPVLHAVLQKFRPPIDRNGRVDPISAKEFVAAFTVLRVQYIRSQAL